MSNRYGAVALRTPRDPDAETLLREVAGVPPHAALVPSDVPPFSRKGDEGTLSVISLANGWRVVWGGFALEWGDPDAVAVALERASAGGEAVFWFVEGVSGVFGFMVFEDGRRVRHWIQSEGEVVENDGDALPGEPDGLFGGEPDEDVDEWTVVETIVAPRVAPWEEIVEAPYATFRVGAETAREVMPKPSSGGGGILGALRRWLGGG